MAFHTFNSASTHTAIQRQRRSTVYLFSILILCFTGNWSFAQTDSVIKLIEIKNSYQLSNYFNDQAISANQPFRIIHFGDSHIQGDRITNEIRSNLQGIYGSGGSGIIFPYSLTGSFGPLGTKSSVKGAYSYASQLKNSSARPIGIMGYELLLQNGAEFTISFNDKFNGKLSNKMDLWIYSISDSLKITFSPNVNEIQCLQLGQGIRKYSLLSSQPIDSISFQTNDICALWGIEFIPETGLIYQQSGVVGAQFTHLIKHEDEVFTQLKHIRPNVLIFSYGTNESYSKIDTVRYENQVKIFLRKLHLELPQTAILLTNAPDTRSGGRIPINELSINRALERIAHELELSFYDANTAMGGWGSLYTWNEKGYFNKDLLHFSSSGAKVFGKLLLHELLRDLLKAKDLKERIEIELRAAVPLNDQKQEVNDSIPESSNAATVKQRKERNYYIVKSGDTLGKIAQRTGRSVNELVKKNNLKSADRIKPGQRIVY